MARQNIGTPRFYIDYIQYWNAKGLIHGFGPYGDSEGEDETGIGGRYGTLVDGGSAYKPELIGFDPSIYMDTPRYPNISNDNLYDYYILMLNDRVFLPNSGKLFCSLLNNNLNETDSSWDGVSVFKTLGLYGYGNETPPSTSSSYFDYYYLVVDAVETEIINFDTASGVAYNGFSIMRIDNADTVVSANSFNATQPEWSDVPYGEGFDLLTFRTKRGYTTSDWNANGTPGVRNILGSLNIGGIYDMPNSPDLSISMVREYDGIEEQTALGGKTFKHIRYSGPPNWRNDLPAWGLTKNIVDESKAVNQSFRGRRIWNLKFSYLSSDDLFAVNESISTANPSDSGTNGSYETTDFVDGDLNNFLSNIGSDSSFFGMVMEKTIGGSLPFIFQPDGNNNSPDQFALCTIDQESIEFEQVASNVYNVSLKIRETW